MRKPREPRDPNRPRKPRKSRKMQPDGPPPADLQIKPYRGSTRDDGKVLLTPRQYQYRVRALLGARLSGIGLEEAAQQIGISVKDARAILTRPEIKEMRERIHNITAGKMSRMMLTLADRITDELEGEDWQKVADQALKVHESWASAQPKEATPAAGTTVNVGVQQNAAAPTVRMEEFLALIKEGEKS